MIKKFLPALILFLSGYICCMKLPVQEKRIIVSSQIKKQSLSNSSYFEIYQALFPDLKNTVVSYLFLEVSTNERKEQAIKKFVKMPINEALEWYSRIKDQKIHDEIVDFLFYNHNQRSKILYPDLFIVSPQEIKTINKIVSRKICDKQDIRNLQSINNKRFIINTGLEMKFIKYYFLNPVLWTPLLSCMTFLYSTRKYQELRLSDFQYYEQQNAERMTINNLIMTTKDAGLFAKYSQEIVNSMNESNADALCYTFILRFVSYGVMFGMNFISYNHDDLNLNIFVGIALDFVLNFFVYAFSDYRILYLSLIPHVGAFLYNIYSQQYYKKEYQKISQVLQENKKVDDYLYI